MDLFIKWEAKTTISSTSYHPSVDIQDPMIPGPMFPDAACSPGLESKRVPRVFWFQKYSANVPKVQCYQELGSYVPWLSCVTRLCDPQDPVFQDLTLYYCGGFETTSVGSGSELAKEFSTFCRRRDVSKTFFICQALLVSRHFSHRTSCPAPVTALPPAEDV